MYDFLYVMLINLKDSSIENLLKYQYLTNNKKKSLLPCTLNYTAFSAWRHKNKFIHIMKFVALPIAPDMCIRLHNKVRSWIENTKGNMDKLNLYP